MNGYGHFVKPLFWSIFTGGVGSLTRRAGQPAGAAWRGDGAARAAARGKARVAGIRVMLALPLLAVVGSGAWYYYNTHILNPFRTDKAVRDAQARYEKLYKKYERTPIPKITAVDTAVNIYPENRSFNATGTYKAVNETDKPIEDIQVTNGQESLKETSFDRPATATLADSKLGFWIYHLATPLNPGESIEIRFKCSYENPGFRNSNEKAEFAKTAHSSIVATFLRSAMTTDGRSATRYVARGRAGTTGRAS